MVLLTLRATRAGLPRVIFKFEVTSYQAGLHFAFICYLPFKGKKVLCLNKIVIILVVATGILCQFVF